MTDDEAIARLAENGVPLDAYFLIGKRGQQRIAFWEPSNGVMAGIIRDGKLSRAYKRVLRKLGAREFGSASEVYQVACEERWPNWEKFQDGIQRAPADRPRD
jgi:hypothetical protein